MQESIPVPAGRLDAKHRPVLGGLQINHNSPYRCTFGVNVNEPGIGRSFLTASHCTYEEGAARSTPAYQRQWGLSADSIGVEIEDPPFRTYGRFCEEGWLCRYSDAALFRLAAGVDWSLGKIARVGGSDGKEIIGEYTITGKAPPPATGYHFHKVGWSTGHSSGWVDRSCFTYRIEEGSNKYLMCQTEVVAEAASGDSGAPVFWVGSDPSEVLFAGILHSRGLDGNRFFFSPIGGIEDDFGRSFDVVAPAQTLSVQISGPTQIQPGATCTWDANVSGGTPPYSYWWSGQVQPSGGTDPWYTGGKDPAQLASWFRLRVDVSDAAGSSTSHEIIVTEDSNAMFCMI
jgi:hypothetical protein